MNRIFKRLGSILLGMVTGVNVLSAQAIPKYDELDHYIEYLVTAARQTEVNYQLVLENAGYLLKVSHYTYSNYLSSSARLPEDAIDKSGFMTRRASEIASLNSQYNENNQKNKSLRIPKTISETLQEYITVSNTVTFKMNEIAQAISAASQAQYELVQKLWTAYTARGEKLDYTVRILPDLKSFSPEIWDSEQQSIKSGLSRQYDLYIKLVKAIEKLEGVPFNKTFKIANQQAIREENEKIEAAEREKKKKELAGYRISTLFEKKYRVLELPPVYNIQAGCREISSYSEDLKSKGFDTKAFEKLKNICGQFDEKTSAQVYSNLTAYFITDLTSNDGGDVRTLIWVPKDENEFLEKDHAIFTDSEGFILLGSRLLHTSGRVNTPENTTDSLIIGKYFRNEENRAKLDLFTYSNRLESIDFSKNHQYLRILAGNNKDLDSVFKALSIKPQLPACINDHYGYNNITKEKKRKEWEIDCRRKMDDLIAYKIFQYNRWNQTKAKIEFYDIYWVPGDENQSKDISVRPLTAEGYLLVFYGFNYGHIIEKLRRKYD